MCKYLRRSASLLRCQHKTDVFIAHAQTGLFPAVLVQSGEQKVCITTLSIFNLPHVHLSLISKTCQRQIAGDNRGRPSWPVTVPTRQRDTQLLTVIVQAALGRKYFLHLPFQFYYKFNWINKSNRYIFWDYLCRPPTIMRQNAFLPAWKVSRPVQVPPLTLAQPVSFQRTTSLHVCVPAWIGAAVTFWMRRYLINHSTPHPNHKIKATRKIWKCHFVRHRSWAVYHFTKGISPSFFIPPFCFSSGMPS